MPELPEVEVCSRNLDRWSVGRRLAEVRAADGKAVRSKLSTRPSDALPQGLSWLEERVGEAFGATVRWGKRLLWPLGEDAMLVHLGMTGKWLRSAECSHASRIRLQLRLDDGSWLLFEDPRRFGCVVPVDALDPTAVLGAGLGPDALREPLDGPALAARLGSRGQLKVLLMDQQRIAGVGNIQAAEALHRAGLHPWWSPADLRPAEWDTLARCLLEQLEYTITVTDAEDVEYMSDGAHVANPFAVYGREGQDCGRCGGSIAKARQGGRATFWCASCQPKERDP